MKDSLKFSCCERTSARTILSDLIPLQMANGQTPTTVYDPCTGARENKFNKTTAAREYAWNFKIFPTFPSLWGTGIRFHTEQASASSTLYQITFLHPGSRSFVFSGSCENSSGAVAAVKDRIYKRSSMLSVTTATGRPLPEPPALGWWVTRGQRLHPALPQVPNAASQAMKGCRVRQTPATGTREGSELKQRLERHP